MTDAMHKKLRRCGPEKFERDRRACGLRSVGESLKNQNKAKMSRQGLGILDTSV